MAHTFYGLSKDQRLAARRSFIPKDARPVLEHDNGSACYVYETAGRLYAVAFWGSSARSLWHYSFRTEEQRNKAIWDFKTSVEHSIERKAKASTEKKAWTNPAKVGDILYTSWGYDQTNVEFYAVTKVSGKRVWVREIVQDSETTGYMQERCWPAMPIRFVEKAPETMHIARSCGERGGYAVKINKSATAYLETGRSHYSSSYA